MPYDNLGITQAAAEQYVQDQAAQLAQQYQAQYAAAQADLQKQQSDAQTQLDTYAGNLNSEVTALNQAQKDQAAAVANSESSRLQNKYLIPTQPAKNSGSLPFPLFVAGYLAYRFLIKKG